MRNYKLIISKAESVDLRCKLETHLATLFSNSSISKYVSMNNREPELQILSDQENNACALPQLKMAYSIWSAMDIADRHNVLGKFQRLCLSSPLTSSKNQKTLIFCALFIHEFSAILAEAIGWPH
jgi:hypothetical protein